MRKKQRASVWRSILVVNIALIGFGSGHAFSQNRFTLSSPAFAPGATIPDMYTCSGEDKSPALSWSNVPKASRRLALIVSDPDAPMGTFVHWVIYDIPASLNGLAQGIAKTGTVIGTGLQGVNSAGQVGYTGPCPPGGSPHHYHFRLYALDSATQGKPGLSAGQLESRMRGHILSSTEIVGIFQR